MAPCTGDANDAPLDFTPTTLHSSGTAPPCHFVPEAKYQFVRFASRYIDGRRAFVDTPMLPHHVALVQVPAHLPDLGAFRAGEVTSYAPLAISHRQHTTEAAQRAHATTTSVQDTFPGPDTALPGQSITTSSRGADLNSVHQSATCCQTASSAQRTLCVVGEASLSHCNQTWPCSARSPQLRWSSSSSLHSLSRQMRGASGLHA